MKARMKRLFGPDGRCCNVAIDHGMFGSPGLLHGIEELAPVVSAVLEGKPDAIQLAPGSAADLQAGPRGARVSLVLRVDVTNVYVASDGRHLFSELCRAPVERAVRLDAAAVVVNLLDVADHREVHHQCIRNVLELKAACDQFAMPLMVEVLAMSPASDGGGYGICGEAARIATLVRQAVELGADVIKADPTDDLEEYGRVVRVSGGRPVLVRGGPAVSEDAALARTRQLMRQGAAGVVYGRNVTTHPDPARMTRALMAVVHG